MVILRMQNLAMEWNPIQRISTGGRESTGFQDWV